MVIKYDGPVFAHMLQTIKGWSLLTVLDKTAPIASVSATRASNWVAGRVGYITGNGTIDLLTASIAGSSRPMPLYLWQGATDLDVLASGAVGSSTYWQNAVPAGFITGLVATGGYELQTTEFDAGGNYTPNTPLSVMADTDGDYSRAGKLTPTAFNTNNYVCGIASLHCQWLYNAPHNIDRPTKATGTNANGVNTLTFWTYYLPKSA